MAVPKLCARRSRATLWYVPITSHLPSFHPYTPRSAPTPKARGQELIQQEEEDGNKAPVKFVQTLLDLRQKYEHLLRQGLNNDRQFTQAIGSVRGAFLEAIPEADQQLRFSNRALKKC